MLAGGFEFSQLFDSGNIIFVMCGVVAVSAIAFPQWRRVREVEAQARLKHKMIDRGFSADEIERVLTSGESSLPDVE